MSAFIRTGAHEQVRTKRWDREWRPPGVTVARQHDCASTAHGDNRLRRGPRGCVAPGACSSILAPFPPTMIQRRSLFSMGLIASLFLAWTLAPPAQAQSRSQAPSAQRPSGGQSVPAPAYHAPSSNRGTMGGAERSIRGHGSTGLPGWAAPSSPPSSFGNRGSRAPGMMNNAAPGMPNSPSQVPVDGGLGWLAAAGAAYAASRLRKTNGSDDEAPDDAP